MSHNALENVSIYIQHQFGVLYLHHQMLNFGVFKLGGAFSILACGVANLTFANTFCGYF